MQFWRLHVEVYRGGEYDVFYKSFINLLNVNVPRNAVADGDLCSSFMRNVTVEEISSEQYYENMYE